MRNKAITFDGWFASRQGQGLLAGCPGLSLDVTIPYSEPKGGMVNRCQEHIARGRTPLIYFSQKLHAWDHLVFLLYYA